MYPLSSNRQTKQILLSVLAFFFLCLQAFSFSLKVKVKLSSQKGFILQSLIGLQRSYEFAFINKRNSPSLFQTLTLSKDNDDEGHFITIFYLQLLVISKRLTKS